MRTLDLYVAGFPHGSAAGFERGCHGNAECPNHGSGELMTCRRAWEFRASDFTASRQPSDTVMSLDRLPDVRAIARALETAPEPAPKLLKAKPERRAPSAVKVQPARPRAVKAKPEPVRVVEPDHGTEESYQLGCFTIECPASPTCEQVHLARLGLIELPKPQVAHGTEEGYQAGCFTNSRPNIPSCETVHLTALGLMVPPAAKAPRRPYQMRLPRVPRGKSPKHGTEYSWMEGCRSIEDCPNTAAGEPSCVEVHRTYHRNYQANRRASKDIRHHHGTTTGYQLGCYDRTECPGGRNGVTCSDAALQADVARRRLRGVEPAPERVDSAEVVAHVNVLVAAGMGPVSIGAAAGVPKTFVRVLIYGRQDSHSSSQAGRHGQIPKRVDAVKAAAVLQVTPQPRVYAHATPEHGTRAAYRAYGCNSRTDCPNVATGGISCLEANHQYQLSRAQNNLEKAN